MGKEFEIGRPIAYYSYGNHGRRCVIVRAVAYLFLADCLSVFLRDQSLSVKCPPRCNPLKPSDN